MADIEATPMVDGARGANPKAREAMRYALIVLALTALAGCVSGTTVFHSADGRQNVICRGAGFWWVPFTTASSDYHACRAAQQKSGYLEGPVTARPIDAPASFQGPS
jgi:hypothetical protein